MSELVDMIAGAHGVDITTIRDRGTRCICGVVLEDNDMPRHVAEVTEAAVREYLAALAEPDGKPGNPYSYDPWEDESVDPSNLDEVVSAAVSEGWKAGAWHMADQIHRMIKGELRDST